MGQKPAEDDERVIQILIKHPKTRDAYGVPLRSVSKAMGWDSAETRAFVNRLVDEGKICRMISSFKTHGEGEALEMGNSWWERGLD